MKFGDIVEDKKGGHGLLFLFMLRKRVQLIKSLTHYIKEIMEQE